VKLPTGDAGIIVPTAGKVKFCVKALELVAAVPRRDSRILKVGFCVFPAASVNIITFRPGIISVDKFNISPFVLFSLDTNPKYIYETEVFEVGIAPPKRREAENDTLSGYDSFERNLIGVPLVVLVTMLFVPG